MDKSIFKMDKEELQQWLHFRKAGFVKQNKKGKGSYKRKSKHSLPLMIISLLVLMSTVVCAQPVTFLQTDEQWANEKYGYSIIANSGCGPTCMAMTLNYYIDESITPLQTAIYADEKQLVGLKGTNWDYFKQMANEYNLEYLQTNSAQTAKQWMMGKNNPLVICSMKRGLWTTGGHFILLWNIDEDNNVYINDPASTKRERVFNTFYKLSTQCKQYFCFNRTNIENEVLTLFDKNLIERSLTEILGAKAEGSQLFLYIS